MTLCYNLVNLRCRHEFNLKDTKYSNISTISIYFYAFRSKINKHVTCRKSNIYRELRWSMNVNVRQLDNINTWFLKWCIGVAGNTLLLWMSEKAIVQSTKHANCQQQLSQSDTLTNENGLWKPCSNSYKFIICPQKLIHRNVSVVISETDGQSSFPTKSIDNSCFFV